MLATRLSTLIIGLLSAIKSKKFSTMERSIDGSMGSGFACQSGRPIGQILIFFVGITASGISPNRQNHRFAAGDLDTIADRLAEQRTRERRDM